MSRGLSIIFFSILFSLASGQTYRSPFNQLQVPVPGDSDSYSFLVSGHFYGGSGSGTSGFPASTILAAIDTINRSGADFLLSTGDMFIDAESDLPRYHSSFFGKLRMPLINAVGNHDVDSDRYGALFGETCFQVHLGPDRLIVLDTEKDDSNIRGVQLDFLRSALADVSRGKVRNVFILSHRPVWAEQDDKYSPLFKHNTRSVFTNNYSEDVLPLLQEMAGHAKVFWFSGSMGGSAPSSIFHVEHLPNLYFVQSAIRNRPADAVLKVEVGPSGIDLSAFSLTGKNLPPVEELDVAYWSRFKAPERGFNWRLLPYYAKTYAVHPAFWSGVVIAVLIGFVLRFASRRLL
jgi:hypothetical protein